MTCALLHGAGSGVGEAAFCCALEAGSVSWLRLASSSSLPLTINSLNYFCRFCRMRTAARRTSVHVVRFCRTRTAVRRTSVHVIPSGDNSLSLRGYWESCIQAQVAGSARYASAGFRVICEVLVLRGRGRGGRRLQELFNSVFEYFFFSIRRWSSRGVESFCLPFPAMICRKIAFICMYFVRLGQGGCRAYMWCFLVPKLGRYVCDRERGGAAYSPGR